ncbi:MAG: response regulator transcription factor [Rhodocyclaceae bacterium]|nr:response regulator transcription factor [Rhodocyclaceae bacterium]
MMNDFMPVLLVEDDGDLREALGEYLAIHGCAVTGVGCGMEFYKALASGTRFHVAIIDLGLPDQNGHVLAEYARNNTPMSVVIITANDTLANRVQTYGTGADLFIAKPIDSSELLAAVRAMDGRFRERTSASEASDGRSGASIRDFWQLDEARRRLLPPNARPIELNPHEALVCEVFREAGPTDVDRRLLVERLFGRNDGSAQRALDNVMRRLRQKITENTGAPAPILTAYGIGYRFSEPLRSP